MINKLPPSGLHQALEPAKPRHRRDASDFDRTLHDSHTPPEAPRHREPGHRAPRSAHEGHPPPCHWTMEAPTLNTVHAAQASSQSIRDGHDAGAVAALVVESRHLQAGSGTGQPASEVIELPWRLTANAGLSYRQLFDGASGYGSTIDTLDGTATEIDTPGAIAAGATNPMHRFDVAVENQSRAFSLADHPDLQTRLEGTNPRQRAERALEWLATHTEWSERLLRWFGDDADVTAWVRDFQLGEVELSDLVHLLKQYAAEHGRPLNRVMHNGQEVWRNPFHQPNHGSDS